MKGQKLLNIIIPLIVTALLGLLGLQALLLRNVYEQKEVAFDRSVMNVLHSVARDLERREMEQQMYSFMGTFQGGSVTTFNYSNDTIRFTHRVFDPAQRRNRETIDTIIGPARQRKMGTDSPWPNRWDPSLLPAVKQQELLARAIDLIAGSQRDPLANTITNSLLDSLIR